MVNWEKECQNVDNKIIINFIDYNNIKFYTIKDINNYFNGNDDNNKQTFIELFRFYMQY